MKRRTNTSSRNPRPRPTVESLPVPQDFINMVGLWAYTFADPRPSAVAQRAEWLAAVESMGGKIVPTDRRHKGCKVFEIFYEGSFAFDFSVDVSSVAR